MARESVRQWLLALLLLTYACLAFRSSHGGSFRRTARVPSDRRLAMALDVDEYSILSDKSSFKLFKDEESSQSSLKPPLIFLPGLDGVGNYSFRTVRNLSASYDIWRLQISPEDRSSFLDLSSFLVQVIKQFPTPIVLLGESFGGLLACHVASRAQDRVAELVLINPATSYDQTGWSITAPLIARSGSLFPVISVATLLITTVEPNQFLRISRDISSRITSMETASIEIDRLIQTGSKIVSLLPPATLQHRISRWLNVGVETMTKRYDLITSPTLVLVSENDRLLPSQKEGTRLKSKLRSVKIFQVISFPDSGHALLDGNVDLLRVIRDSDVFFVKNDIYDVKYPSEDKFKKNLDVLNKIYSPVFLSRGRDGRLRRGLANVPTGQSGRPVLLVGNHQLLGGDLSFLVGQFLVEKSCLIRGLAHPFIFQSGNASSSRDRSGMMETFQQFGAVPVTPMAYYELLKRNETILLFPGGAREALHLRGEDYKVFWFVKYKDTTSPFIVNECRPERSEFVRMAAAMDAIIVPFAAIGVADSVNMLLDRTSDLSLNS